MNVHEDTEIGNQSKTLNGKGVDKMFEKLKRYIHRIKRHRRNRKISKWADVIFQVSRRCSYKIGLNPLVYEIIRMRYPNEFLLNLFPDYTSKDKYTELWIFRGQNE